MSERRQREDAVMTPDQAADLAARTLAEIPSVGMNPWDEDAHDADRERVASDLDGLKAHTYGSLCLLCGRLRGLDPACPDAARYADGLVRTAALYGVEP